MDAAMQRRLSRRQRRIPMIDFHTSITFWRGVGNFLAAFDDCASESIFPHAARHFLAFYRKRRRWLGDAMPSASAPASFYAPRDARPARQKRMGRQLAMRCFISAISRAAGSADAGLERCVSTLLPAAEARFQISLQAMQRQWHRDQYRRLRVFGHERRADTILASLIAHEMPRAARGMRAHARLSKMLITTPP